KFFKILNDMLRYGVPLSISTIIGGFLLQFYGFMMAFYCNDVMIGNYQVANNFAVLLTFFTIPIATVLFPAFAKLNPQNEPELVKTVFKSSVKYTAILLVPATTAVMVLAQPMVSTLFGEQYVYAPFFLSLLVITNLTAAFGNLSMNALLTGLGETKALMKLSLLTLALGFLLAFLLIPNLGITGIIIGNLIASIPSTLLGLGWIFKKYRVSADLRSTAKVFASTAIVTGITYISLSFFNTAEWMRLMVGGIVFLVSYLIVAPFMGAIVKEDIHNLRALFSGMGFIVKIINLPFIIAEKAASIKNN
ncbi:MAG: oligosaccharide flippase family protein, partial [Candidatus Bathyarchaeota archaeon]